MDQPRPRTTAERGRTTAFPPASGPAAVPFLGQELAAIGQRVLDVLVAVLEGFVLGDGVGPELVEVGIGGDRHVRQLAADLLDFADIHGLNDLAVFVERDVALGRLELDDLERCHEFHRVLEIAIDCLDRSDDRVRADIAVRSLVGRQGAHPLFEFRDEALVLGRLEHWSVEQARIHPERRVAELRQVRLVDDRAEDIEDRQLALEAELGILPAEPEAVGARVEGHHGVRLAVQVGQIRPEVGGPDRRPLLLDDLPAELAERVREAVDRVDAAGIVGADGRHLAPALLVGPVGRRGRDRAAVLRGADEIGIGERSRHGEFVRPGVPGQHQRNLALPRIVVDGERFAGGDDTGENLRAVALDELAGLRYRDVRFALGVLDDQFELVAGRLVADLVEIHLDAGEGLLTVRGEVAGKRQQDAELDRVGRLRGQTRRGDGQRDRACHQAGAQRVPARRPWRRAKLHRLLVRHGVASLLLP
jgi:hypothetical protein